MCGIMELAPKIALASFRKAWQNKTGSPWSGKSGAELKAKIQNAAEFRKRLGKTVMDKIGKAHAEQWDISLLSKLLLEDPGLLKESSDASKALKEVRERRNSFVHEFPTTMSQTDFDEMWAAIMNPLSRLADFCGPDTKKLLDGEKTRILKSQTIDQEKESRFSAEAKKEVTL